MNVAEALAEIAAQPAARWPALVAARFTDPALAAQALLWLNAQAVPQVSDRYVLGRS